jgi:drug/metabolite transporter (DMT)-like permease
VSSHSIAPYVCMLCGCVVFAVMSTLAHEAGEHCDWQTVAFFRSFLVLLFVGTYAVSRGTQLVFFRPARLWMRSLAGSCSLVTAFYALAKLKASTVVTLTNTFPLWVAILSWPMLGSLPSPRVWLAVLGGVAGVYLIQQPETGGDHPAFAIALISAFFTSLAMIGLHKLKGVDPNAVVVHFSFVATIFSAAAFFVFDRDAGRVTTFDRTTVLLLLGVGLTASLGQMLLTRAFAHGDPAKVAVVGLSQVVFTLLLDVAFTGHHLTWPIVFGTSMILAPTAWVMLERNSKKGIPAVSPENLEPESVGVER